MGLVPTSVRSCNSLYPPGVFESVLHFNMTDYQLNFFDFTVPALDLDHETLKAHLEGFAKKWAFQLEEGDSGYLHFQGRVSLIKKRRRRELVAIFETISGIKGVRWSITSNGGTKAWSYVLKKDTRKDGPWTSMDCEHYVPIQFRVKNLLLWQQEIVQWCKDDTSYDDPEKRDFRTVHILIDRKGGAGKSTLAHSMGSMGTALCIPPMQNAKDIIQFVFDMPVATVYFIDLPRSTDKTKQQGLFSAIEQLKTGYLYDIRYHGRAKYIDSPAVWVFTNKRPATYMLTRDRWKLWCIKDAHLKALPL